MNHVLDVFIPRSEELTDLWQIIAKGSFSSVTVPWEDQMGYSEKDKMLFSIQQAPDSRAVAC